MHGEFARMVAEVPDLFASLGSAEPFIEKGVAWQADKQGVYAFFESGKPVHVGRTRHLQRRLRGHVSKRHNSASFVFKRVRRVLGRERTYRPEGSRDDLMKDRHFMEEFEKQRALTKGMQVRFVEIRDPVLQYLLELYACMEWGLPLDEFDTH